MQLFTFPQKILPVLRRTLSYETQHIYQSIDKTYQYLINHSRTASTPCNFISEVVDRWAHNNPQALAIQCIEQDNHNRITSISYAELTKRSHEIADFFLKQNIKKGDAVALMLGQHLTWWYSVAGLMRAGIAIVPCPRLLTSKDLAYRINDLNIKGIITTPELQPHVDSIRTQCPSLKLTVTTGKEDNNWLSLSDIFNTRFNLIYPTTTSQDPCVYLYTSGTTGHPKAVQHNHDYPFFHWPTGKNWLRATPEDLVYNASDTGWGFTLWVTLGVWATGSKLLVTPTNAKFDPHKMLTLLQEQAVTIFCAAPTVLRRLVADPHFASMRFPHLKRIITVGEALDETVIEQFAAHGIEVRVGFGQAETPLLMGRLDEQPHVAGTMGQPIQPYKVVILDEEHRPLPSGNTGQIALDLINGKTGGLMRGYANAPDRTKKSFSPDGQYYLTGDWAFYRKDGFFVYQGRKDDLIKSHGYRIGPAEIEEAGMSHPAVAKIAAIGVRTKIESVAITVKAFILLKPGYTETPSLIHEIQEHIKKETAPHKYPRLVECLSLEEWEKYETTSGKIRRAGLREREENKLKHNDPQAPKLA